MQSLVLTKMEYKNIEINVRMNNEAVGLLRTGGWCKVLVIRHSPRELDINSKKNYHETRLEQKEDSL